MIITNPLILLMVPFCLFFGCQIADDGSFRDKDGSILLASESEIVEKQKILLNTKYPDGLPENAQGGVVFDGKVSTVQVSKNGLHITKFIIKDVLFGVLEDNKLITIYSPSIEKGGIDFKVGEEYRVFTVYINDAYRTWNWTGTVKKEIRNDP